MGRRLEGKGHTYIPLPSCDPGVLPCRICMGRRSEGADIPTCPRTPFGAPYLQTHSQDTVYKEK